MRTPSSRLAEASPNLPQRDAAQSQYTPHGRMHQAVADHNACQVLLSDTIRLGTKNTLNTLVTMALKTLRVASRSPEMADDGRLPGIYTNRGEVGRMACCGSRTVYNHLAKLEAAGLVYKQFRGRQHDFVVWINPWILLGTAFPQPKAVDLSQMQNPGFKLDIRPNLPPKSTLETISNVSNSGVKSVEKLGDIIKGAFGPPISRVDKDVRNLTLERAVEPLREKTSETLDRSPGGARPGGDQPTAHETLKPRSDDDKGGEQAGRPADLTNPQASGPTPAKPDTGRPRKSGADFDTHQYQKRLVMGFWELSRQRFWPAETFSVKHTATILNLLWQDVFLSFEKCPNERNSNVLYQARCQQIDKAERYFRKQNWTVMPPLAYFSHRHYEEQVLKGEKGNFHHTTAWQIADEKARAALDKQRLVDKAVASVLAGKPPRNWKGADGQIALYTYWRDRIRKVCSLDLLNRFDNEVGVHLSIRDTSAIQS